MQGSDATVRAWGRRAVLAGGAAMVAAPALAQQAPQLVNNILIGRDGWLLPTYLEPQQLPPRSVDKAVCDLVVEACGILRAARLAPVVGLIPSKNRLYRQTAGVTTPPASPEWQQRYAFLLGELRRGNTLVPDLDAPFRRAIAANPAQTLYFRADTHWTPRGAEIAAAEMARAIREANLLPASSRPGVRLAEPVTQTRPVGDLQRLLPPERRGEFQPEPYQVRLPVQVPASSLLDAAPGDVAAIGSSFLEPRYGYADQLSSQLGRPVALAWRPNTVGPWATLLAYLRSSEFRTARPRLVAWHHLEGNMNSGPSNPDWGRNAMQAQAFLAELRSLAGA